jgi:hypothetical protein
MNNSPTDLLARWIAENVRPVPPAQRNSEARRLAVEFFAFARDADLSDADLAELEEEIGADLRSHMAEALEIADARDDGASA